MENNNFNKRNTKVDKKSTISVNSFSFGNLLNDADMVLIFAEMDKIFNQVCVTF